MNVSDFRFVGSNNSGHHNLSMTQLRERAKELGLPIRQWDDPDGKWAAPCCVCYADATGVMVPVEFVARFMEPELVDLSRPWRVQP